jgi:hypothetical protein
VRAILIEESGEHLRSVTDRGTTFVIKPTVRVMGFLGVYAAFISHVNIADKDPPRGLFLGHAILLFAFRI